ncbi:hypothetical protein ACFLT0_00550 [Chloroflexota bacterium]
MVWILYKTLITESLRRAEKPKRTIDLIDKFIWLWIAFNGWMKAIFGEDTKEWRMIAQVKQLKEMESVYIALKENNQQFRKNLDKLGEIPFVNLRYINNESKDENTRYPKYNNTFESLIELIYQIRNNLFHGMKDSQIKEGRKLVDLGKL